MLPLKEWVNSDEIKKIQNMPKGKMFSTAFFRDPMRVIIINHDLFYAPADGVVLYAKEYDPKDFLEIKGKEFPLTDLLADKDYKERSLVIGIFMTGFDVHINRVPASAHYIDIRLTNNIYTHNVSMIMAENNLLDDFRINKNALGYLRSNEKRISVFSCHAIKGHFYIVQIADRDVDCILNWGQSKHLTQGDRFGQIRFGSQVDVVIPVKYLKNYEVCVKPLDHVLAGVDAIIRIGG